MRRIIALFIALLLALPWSGALAKEDPVLRRAVAYPGEDITIAIPAQYLAFYKDEIGLTISAGIDKTTFYARVKVMPDDPSGFSESEYFENTWLPSLRSIYIGKSYNMVLDEGETQRCVIAGREMTGRPFRLHIAGRDCCDLMCFDRWNGRLIRYELYYSLDDPDPAMTLLETVVYSVTGNALAPAASRQDLAKIEAPDQAFSFYAKPSYPREYDVQNGMTVYTKSQGLIPYVIVYQSSSLIVEAYEYMKEQYTPHMKETYGDQLVNYSEYQQFAIGGRFLPAGRYTYRVQDQSVTMVRVFDSTGNRTVVYTAKYLTDEGADTMAALDAAVAGFQSAAKPLR
ncbi:MAG: hypothetical protein IK099_13380 [Clostridia bacterium]|nr:hypothetical protein [Clostridia bacterium]